MAPVTQLVLFRYYPDIPWTSLEQPFRDFAQLPTTYLKDGKPYMLSMRMAKNTSWENFAKGMTHAFILEFANEADRDYYLGHDKVHHAFSEKAGPLIEDSVVVDIKDGVLFSESLMAKYEVTLNDYQHILCHCRTCQLLGGPRYSCNAIIAKDALKVREGTLSVYSCTGALGKPVLCYHCGNCTS